MKIKTFFKTYFISVSILAHCLIIVMAVYFLSERITTHWRWPTIKRWIMGGIDAEDVYPMELGGFESLPKGSWVKIHQQRLDDRVHFARQAHAGSGFDQIRSRLLLFGSDTHGNDWNNTVYSFDLKTLLWSEAYPPDLPETYTVNSQGIPVAGVKNNHPWAMHTFGALAFDPLHDKLVVASYPGHLAPDKYGQSLASVWKTIKKHPTWLFDTKTSTWEAYEGKSELFFPYAIAYDSDRNVVTGFRPNGIFDWNGDIIGWEKIGDKSTQQYSTNVVYDSVNHVFILYGGNKDNNNVHVYVVGEKSTEKMPTLGQRPPAGQSVPLAFHKKKGKVVALIDGDDFAQTWLYEYSKDQWQRVEKADFPYRVSMNYTMEYDAYHDVLVLVSSSTNEETAVWVLRL